MANPGKNRPGKNRLPPVENQLNRLKILEEELFKTTVTSRKRRNRPSTTSYVATTTVQNYPQILQTEEEIFRNFIKTTTQSSDDLPSPPETTPVILLSQQKINTPKSSTKFADFEILEVEPASKPETEPEESGDTFRKASFFPEINQNRSVPCTCLSYWLFLLVITFCLFNSFTLKLWRYIE